MVAIVHQHHDDMAAVMNDMAVADSITLLVARDHRGLIVAVFSRTNCQLLVASCPRDAVCGGFCRSSSGRHDVLYAILPSSTVCVCSPNKDVKSPR